MSVLQKLTLLILLTVTPSAGAQTQETLPGALEAPAPSEATAGERIVEGRPALYSIKRYAHPFTWLTLAVKPALRNTGSGQIQRFMRSMENLGVDSGVRLALEGAGPSSGFGLQVTPFHKNVLGRGILLEAPLVYTYRQYEVYQFNAVLPVTPRLSYQWLSFDFSTSYSSRAQDAFYGLGNESSLNDKTNFRTVGREASAGFTARINPDWTSGIHGVYRNVGVTQPVSGDSTQDFFDPASVPGLAGGASLWSGVFSLARDTTRREERTFKGGLDHVEIGFNRSPGGEFEYWRLHYDGQRFIWLTNDGRKVLALRGMIETNVTPAGRNVPFFAMPVLGTTTTLRGFDNFRFRDKSALSTTLEYRYRISPQLDWGFFVDGGQVAPTVGDMAFNKFHAGFGTRFFIWPRPDYPISIDYGQSNETWRLYINFRPRF